MVSPHQVSFGINSWVESREKYRRCGVVSSFHLRGNELYILVRLGSEYPLNYAGQDVLEPASLWADWLPF